VPSAVETIPCVTPQAGQIGGRSSGSSSRAICPTLAHRSSIVRTRLSTNEEDEVATKKQKARAAAAGTGAGKDAGKPKPKKKTSRGK
jgi:hypothetical protein